MEGVETIETGAKLPKSERKSGLHTLHTFLYPPQRLLRRFLLLLPFNNIWVPSHGSVSDLPSFAARGKRWEGPTVAG